MKIYHSNERFRIRQTQPEDFQGITALCLRVYPFAKPWGADQLTSHLEYFPEGQVVAEELSSGRIVGMSASLIISWDDYEIDDNWVDFTDHGFFSNHDAENGRTLYGAEMIVDPNFRGQRLGTYLYHARKAIAREHGLLRMRAGARLRGYHRYAEQCTPHEYLLKILSGEVFDPTISFQIKQGFNVMALVRGYLPNDPETLGWAVVIEWLNPELATREDYTKEMNRYRKLLMLPEEEFQEYYRKLCEWSGAPNCLPD